MQQHRPQQHRPQQHRTQQHRTQQHQTHQHEQQTNGNGFPFPEHLIFCLKEKLHRTCHPIYLLRPFRHFHHHRNRDLFTATFLLSLSSSPFPIDTDRSHWKACSTVKVSVKLHSTQKWKFHQRVASCRCCYHEEASLVCSSVEFFESVESKFYRTGRCGKAHLHFSIDC